MHLELRHLRVVDAIARAGSLTCAAAQLGTSQPALSAQLSRIEASLHGQLFRRDRTGVSLTPFGEIILTRIETILGEVEELLAEADANAADCRQLRIACNRSPFLASLIVELERILSGRMLAPTFDFSTTVITESLLSGEVDMVVVGVHPGLDDALPEGIRELVFVESEPFLVAVAEDHPVRGDIIEFADLVGEPWLLPPGRPDGTYAALQRAAAALGTEISAPYGRQSLAEYWPYVAGGKAVALALPTFAPPAGIRLAALAHNPLVGRRSLRWRPGGLSDHEALRCAEAATEVYRTHVAAATAGLTWWHGAPQHHPRLANLSPSAPAPALRAG